ncbi:MAG: LPS export ABC transporter periplasmic protein LptC [Nevskiales bacterium]
MSEAQQPSASSQLDIARRLPDVRWGLLPILLVPVIVSFWPQSPVLVTEQEEIEVILSSELPDYYLQNAKMSALDDYGQLRYQIRAKVMRHYPDKSANATELRMDYFGPQGRWRITAPQGKAYADSNELLLSGGVLAKGSSSPRHPETVMRMDTATIFPGDMQLDTKDPVSIDDPNRTVRATGMTMDIDKNVVKLKKNVRVHHEP